MAIADTIQSMYDNVSNAYNVLEVAGADLTNVDKNILNLKSTWQERLLYFMNNGTDVVWNNWDKVTGEGTSLTLNNTKEAKMKIVLKGNTSQETTSGKNKLQYTLEDLKTNNTGGTWNNNVYTWNGITFTINDDLSVKANGTATAASYLYVNFYNLGLTSGTEYILNGCPSGGASSTYSLRIYAEGSYHSDTGNGLSFTFNNQTIVRVNVSNGTNVNNLLFQPMIRLSSVSDSSYEMYTNGASPNPDYPQEVHTVSGDNVVRICGKNINDGINDKFYLTSTTTSYKSSDNDAGICIRVDGASSYTISTTTTQTRYRAAVTNKLPSSTTQDCYNGVARDGTNNSFTIDTTGYKYLLVNATDISAIQIEKGSTATTYEPYQSQSYSVNLGSLELCKIGTYQDRFIRNSGKNKMPLLNGSATLNGLTITIENGIVTINGTASNGATFKLSNGIEGVSGASINDNWLSQLIIKNKKNYTISVKYLGGTGATSGCAFRLYSNTSTYLNQFYPLTQEQSLTYPDDGKISLITFFANPGNTFTNYKFAIQLEEGSSVTDFEPYGNGDWYLEKKIGKKVFNGTENWGGTTFGNYYRVQVSVDDIIGGLSANDIDLYSNYFYGNNGALNSEQAQVGMMAHYRQNTNCYFVTNLTSYQDFKTWLSTHNTTFYYRLNTPTYTKIEGELANQLDKISGAKSYNSQTNISQENNDLASILNATALGEM